MDPACRIDDTEACARLYPRQARQPFNVTGQPAIVVPAGFTRTGLPLSELARTAMDRVPQVLESIKLPSRRPLAEMKSLARLQERVESELGAEGRVLVRWSGTEAKLRIMLEGPDERRLRDWSKEMAEAATRDVEVGT